MITRGFIFMRLIPKILFFGLLLFTSTSSAQEQKPVYRAIYPHQMAETTLYKELAPNAIKNGFVTYQKKDGTTAKIFLPKNVQKIDDFRLWFMLQADKPTLVNNLISDHLSAAYRTQPGGQPIMGFSVAPKNTALHISMFGLGSSFSGHIPCTVIEITPDGGGICRPKDFLNPLEMQKIAEGVTSRNVAMNTQSVLRGMNAESILLGINRDEIQSFIFRQSTPNGEVVLKKIPAMDIFKLFDEYKGMLSSQDIEYIFGSVFHKSELTYNSKSSFNAQFEPLEEIKKKIETIVDVKTKPVFDNTPSLLAISHPDEASLTRLTEVNKIYNSLQNNPAQGTSPANRNPLLDRKINYPLKRLIIQANDGINVTAESIELLAIAKELKADPENIKRIAISQSPLNERIKNLTKNIDAVEAMSSNPVTRAEYQQTLKIWSEDVNKQKTALSTNTTPRISKITVLGKIGKIAGGMGYIPLPSTMRDIYQDFKDAFTGETIEDHINEYETSITENKSQIAVIDKQILSLENRIQIWFESPEPLQKQIDILNSKRRQRENNIQKLEQRILEKNIDLLNQDPSIKSTAREIY